MYEPELAHTPQTYNTLYNQTEKLKPNIQDAPPGARPVALHTKCNIQLSAEDVLAPATMKNAAKCDT